MLAAQSSCANQHGHRITGMHVALPMCRWQNAPSHSCSLHLQGSKNLCSMRPRCGIRRECRVGEREAGRAYLPLALLSPVQNGRRRGTVGRHSWLAAPSRDHCLGQPLVPLLHSSSGDCTISVSCPNGLLQCSLEAAGSRQNEIVETVEVKGRHHTGGYSSWSALQVLMLRHSGRAVPSLNYWMTTCHCIK